MGTKEDREFWEKCRVYSLISEYEEEEGIYEAIKEDMIGDSWINNITIYKIIRGR